MKRAKNGENAIFPKVEVIMKLLPSSPPKKYEWVIYHLVENCKGLFNPLKNLTRTPFTCRPSYTHTIASAWNLPVTPFSAVSCLLSSLSPIASWGSLPLKSSLCTERDLKIIGLIPPVPETYVPSIHSHTPSTYISAST